MKATQNNAVWESKSYKQGSSEDNWAAVKATVRVPKEPLMVESATTTQATVHAPYDVPGATQDYVLYNPTDGEVPYTVSVNNNVATTLSGDNYYDVSSADKTDWCGGATDACAGIFTADGNYAYFKSLTGGFWYKVGLPTPFKLNNTLNTLESTFSLTTAASEDGTKNMMVSYAAGGNYIYLWGEGQTVARYTLTTPYLMETATDLQTYDLTSYLNAFFLNGQDRSGFSGFKVSADGTKGVCCLKLWGNTNGNGYITNYLQGFTLGTPFDLGTITATSGSNLMGYDSTGEFAGAFSVSESGDYVEAIIGPYNSTPYYRSYYLNTPWDVTSGSNVTSEYLNNWHAASSLNTHQHSNLYNKQDNLVYAVWQGTWKRDIGFLNGGGNPYPTATLDYTAAGLTAAPTIIYKDNVKPSDVEYAVLTREEADRDGKALGVSSGRYNNDVLNTLKVYPDLDYQGASALTAGDVIDIDGTKFTLPANPTFTDDDTLYVGGPTAKPEIGTSSNYKLHDIITTQKYIGTTQVTSPSTYTPLDSTAASTPNGMDFSSDGKKMFLSGYADNFGGDANIDAPIVEFDLSVPWIPGSATLVKAYDGESFSVGSGLNNNLPMNYFQFSADGTKFYSLHTFSTGYVTILVEGSLTTPYDLNTYSYTTSVNVKDLCSGTSYTSINAFTIAPDGKGVVFFGNTAATTMTTNSSNFGYRAKMTVPWSISSLSSMGQFGGYMAFGSLVGSEDRGYFLYHLTINGAYSYDDFFVSSVSGDMGNEVDARNTTIAFNSYSEGQTQNNILGNVNGQALVVKDNATKLYIFIPETSSVMMYTGAYGAIKDLYTVDISSLNLDAEPKSVRFSTAPSFTSMGSTSLSTNAGLYKEYSTPEVSIDAEALRFKIEGDTDATVTRFNADLFT